MGIIRIEIRKTKADWLPDVVKNLTSEGLLSSTIRQALLLIVDLRAGRVDVLLELFPFVTDALMERRRTFVQDTVQDKSAADDFVQRLFNVVMEFYP